MTTPENGGHYNQMLPEDSTLCCQSVLMLSNDHCWHLHYIYTPTLLQHFTLALPSKRGWGTCCFILNVRTDNALLDAIFKNIEITTQNLVP